MAAKEMQFPWPWNGGTISLNLGVIWEMSAKKSAVFFSIILIIFYALVLYFVQPLADLATSLVLKTGIPLDDISSKRHDFIIDISYTSFMFVLFCLLDILTRYKRNISLFGFLFTGYIGRRSEPEYLFRLIVFVLTFVVAPLLAFAFLQPGNLIFSRDRPFDVLDVPFFAGLFLEDGLMEWATFISFAVAGILFLRVALIMRGSGDRTSVRLRWLFYGLVVGVWFVAFEEISWGQRLFGWGTPEVFDVHNLQSETNLHNIYNQYLTGFTESTLGVRYYFVIGAILFLVSWFSCLLDVLGKARAFGMLPHATLVFLAAEISIFAQQNLTQELVEELAAIYIVLLAWQFLRQAKDLGAGSPLKSHTRSPAVS